MEKIVVFGSWTETWKAELCCGFGLLMAAPLAPGHHLSLAGTLGHGDLKVDVVQGSQA